jgi:hypothetical protein
MEISHAEREENSRAIGKRNPALHAAAVASAQRLAGSKQATARWVGKDTLRELTSPSVIRRLAARRRKSARINLLSFNPE